MHPQAFLESLIEEFEKSLNSVLAGRNQLLRCSSLLSSVATSKMGTNASIHILGSGQHDNPKHDVDVDSPSVNARWIFITKSLIEFYLDKHSTVDLGFNDSLSIPIPKRLFILFVSWEHNVPYRSKEILLLYMESGLC